MKILNFGSLNIDKVYMVPHFVEEGETLASTDYREYCGGKGLNQSLALARAGSEVYHAGKVGPDGLFLKKELKYNGVHTEWIEEGGTVTGHALIQVTAKGENGILLFGGANQEIGESHIENVLAHFNKGDWLVLQNEINHLEVIIDAAYQKGMKIVLNPSPMDHTVKSIDLSKLEYLLLNEGEGESITGARNPEHILSGLIKDYPSLKVVLTLGERGCLYQDHRQLLKQESEPVTVVDTTAAGDTFTGYFIKSVMEGIVIQEALRIAVKAAGMAVSKKGAAASIPYRKELS